jgi:hypothetical protein
MSKTVIFLGAGVSGGLGLPVTAQIFPGILERLTGKPPSLLGGDAVGQGRLRRCLNAILPGLSEFTVGSHDRYAWRDRLPPITDVLSAIDYLLLSGKPPAPDLTLSELAQGRILLERSIFELLVRNEGPGALRMEGFKFTHQKLRMRSTA